MQDFNKDLFIPYNLVLQKDGSVKPRNYAEHLIPLENEGFMDFYKRYTKELAHLKPYEKGMWIPYEQERKLYKVLITYCPTHLTRKEIDECLEPKVIITKYFLEKETALQWANNKIKQQSIACYYNKNNPYSRQYKFSYAIIHNGDDVLEASAINGRIL